MKTSFHRAGLLMFITVISATSISATTVPFTEDFTASNANWLNHNSTSFLTHVSSGGPDGGAYASGTFTFEETVTGDTPVILRARGDYDSSDDNFVGDWLDDGVYRLKAFVRHDAPVPLTYFFRAAGPVNFPGAVGINFVPVFPNEWTELSFVITADNPQFVSFEDSDFETVFSSIGHVQFGVSVPESLAENTSTYTFDIDQVSLEPVPEPAAIVLAAVLSALVAVGRRGSFAPRV